MLTVRTPFAASPARSLKPRGIARNDFRRCPAASLLVVKVASILIAACALLSSANAQFLSKSSSASSAHSPSAVVQTEQVRAELVAHAPEGVQAGRTLWIGLQLTHQPQWHTYWKNPGDSGLATQLQWTLPAGVTAGDIVWPTPQIIRIGTLANFGYEGAVLLPIPLTVSPAFKPSGLGSTLEVRLHANWLVCRQECIPQEGQFLLHVPVQGSTAAHTAEFDAARAASPQPLDGTAQAQVSAHGLRLLVTGLPKAWQGQSLNAFPELPEVVDSAKTPNATDPSTTGQTQKVGTQGWKVSAAGSEWSALLPLSTLRSSTPGTFPVVISVGSQSVRAQATVSGNWPPLSTTAEPGAWAAERSAQAPVNNTAPGLVGFAWALMAALLGGLILNLMPCVFPVLAIKVLAFSTHGAHGRAAHRAQGLAYTAGVLLSFLALGGLMLALRAGGEQLGWGFQLQSPPVVAALALLFTLIGLNLMGVLELGHLLPSKVATLQLRHPVMDAFLSGVLAVAVASPCTAPFMGASLGYAIGLPWAQALGIFAALGLGLALPYLVAAWIPGMDRWLPRPGAWMDALRRFMAFLMWATVVWLLWVLGHLNGLDAAASLLALLLAVALVLWALGLPGRSRWVFASISIAATALLASAIGQNVLQTNAPAADLGDTTHGSGNPTTWQAWTPGRVQAELASGRPVFVDFTAAWCITCQYNKQTTLADTAVLADFAAKKVTLLRADWTRRDPAISAALEQLGRSGVPVYVLYQTDKPPVVFSEILGADALHATLATL